MAIVNGIGGEPGPVMRGAQKVVDNAMLTAIGRLTMAAVGPFGIWVFITLTDLRTSSAVQAHDIVEIKQTITDNHNDVATQLLSVATSVAQQITAVKTQINTEMDLRSQIRNAQQDNLKARLDFLEKFVTPEMIEKALHGGK